MQHWVYDDGLLLAKLYTSFFWESQVLYGMVFCPYLAGTYPIYYSVDDQTFVDTGLVWVASATSLASRWVRGSGVVVPRCPPGWWVMNWVVATQKFLECSPRKLGKMKPFWQAYFSDGFGSTTNSPTSESRKKCWLCISQPLEFSRVVLRINLGTFTNSTSDHQEVYIFPTTVDGSEIRQTSW